MPAGLTSRWGWYWVRGFPDLDEPPNVRPRIRAFVPRRKNRDPINQPSRCNTQEGLLSFAQTGDSDLLGGRAHRTANWASFLYAKKPYYQHITYGLQGDWLHVCKAVLSVQTSLGYMFTKQSYWHKLRGLLFKLKAILLVQTARAFVQT